MFRLIWEFNLIVNPKKLLFIFRKYTKLYGATTIVMEYWLFQGNPDVFNVDQYLRLTRTVYWSVTRDKHRKEISIGDIVYIWRAKGKQNTISGVVAKARVIEPCKHIRELNNPEWLFTDLWRQGIKEKSEYKAGLLVEDFRLTPSEGMILFDIFKVDSLLQNLQIVTTHQGTNFRLIKEQADRINRYWQVPNDDENEEYVGREGFIQYRFHRFRERDQLMRGKYIEFFLEQHANLHCELCRFEPCQIYGELGKNLLEIHHLVPLHSLQETQTSLHDLILVCPNCHRAVHKGNPVENHKYLLQRFSERL